MRHEVTLRCRAATHNKFCFQNQSCSAQLVSAITSNNSVSDRILDEATQSGVVTDN